MSRVTAAKKCIVLDLDNTLWGGIVGEDGISGIALSLTAPGNSFLSFQQALLDHYHRGILLAINSRNNENDALQVLREHPNMLLKEHHFAAMRINWNDKAKNIREIAEELNIGTDALVFLDDDPTNRSLVRSLLPEVEVPDLPTDPKEYTRFLNGLPYFESDAITDEDKMRGNLYVTERLRREEEKQFSSKEEFLQSLSLNLDLFRDDPSSLARLSQLTAKTNQFNTNKTPLSEEDIKKLIESNTHHVYYGNLHDIFGDYGIILFCLVEKQDIVWKIESLLMSCRVFDKGVEQVFLRCLVEDAHSLGATKLTITYNETEKNIPAKEFITTYFTEREIHLTSKAEHDIHTQVSVTKHY